LQFLSSATPKTNDAICGRQIAFTAAFILPALKLLEAPALLARYAAGDLLLPALLHFLLQTAVLAVVLFALSRSKYTLLERLQRAFGKGAAVFYIAFAAFFLFVAILPLLDLEKFTYAVFFDTAPTTFSFAFFFIFAAFFCSKGLTAIGRCADICLFLFLFPFLALTGMSLAETDFSNLLPLFGTKFGDTMSAFTYTTPHFSDVILLLPLLANYRPKQGDTKKILIGYGAGGICTLFFLAVFFGVYSSIAPREHYAFAKIAQYFPALDVLGRIDLVFVYLLSIVLFFHACLPLQYATDFISRTFFERHKKYVAAAVCFCAFLFVLFFNRRYNAIYALISGKLYPIFWFIADMVPLFLLFLPKYTPKTNGKNTSKKAVKKEAQRGIAQ